MKEIIEIREASEDKIENIFYFEDKTDANKYLNESKYKCTKHTIPIIEKGKNIEDFKKELFKQNALNKLTKEEKEILGLL
jgi:hypothetical protein